MSNQLDTIESAKKNEARLRLLFPTYGIQCVLPGGVISEDRFAEFGVGVPGDKSEYQIAITSPVPAGPGVSSEAMNSGMVTDTIKKAPSATEAATRLYQMRFPSSNPNDAIMSIPAVKAAVEMALLEAFE